MMRRAGKADGAECLHQRGIEGDGLVRRRQSAGDDHVAGFAAAPFQDQLRRKLQPRQHPLRIHAALEAVARVRDDGLLAAGAGDAGRIEEGGFDEDIDRAVIAAGVLAAHDAGDAERAASSAMTTVSTSSV